MRITKLCPIASGVVPVTKTVALNSLTAIDPLLDKVLLSARLRTLPVPCSPKRQALTR